MYKFIKSILYVLLTVIITVSLTVIIINTLYAEKIEQSVLKIINSNIETEIHLEKIEFTLFEHFPYAAVKLHNISIDESSEFNNDTLLYAKEALLYLNIIDLFSKEYHINKIYLAEGKINIKYNLQNKPNFIIYTPPLSNNEKKNPSISIKDILLDNINLNYLNLAKNININWLAKNSFIQIENQNIEFDTDIYSNHLLINEKNYLQEKSCSFNIKSKLAKNTFIIENSNFIIEDVILKINGEINKNNFLDLKIISENQNLNSIINHAPKHISKIYNPFIITGELNGTAHINGVFEKNKNPHFNMNFSILNGGFDFKSNPFKISDISCSGEINNGERNQFATTKINFFNFYGNTKKGNIEGEFTINNLDDMLLDANLNSDWDLEELNHYFQDSPFLNMTGSCAIKTNYKGKLAFDNKFKKYFISGNHKSKISNLEMNFNYLNSNLDFNILMQELDVNNNAIKINESNIAIGSSKINYSGIIKNFIEYIIGESKQIIINGDVTSPLILFNELSTITQISNSKEQENSNQKLPGWFSSNIKLDVKKLYYNNFEAKKIKGEIKYGDLKLEGKNIFSECLDGILNGEFILYEPTEKYLVLNTKLNLADINIRKSFSSFNNFNQNFIKGNELNGVGILNMDLESHWDPEMNFVNKKFKMKSDLIIKEGELINFKPLENLSSFVNLEDLQHVKFSTLENTIEVKDEVINIPIMEIRSSALSAFISGTHHFNQEIDYSIKLLLSEILSNKLRTKNNDIDQQFGEIKEQEETFTTLYLKMTGTSNETKTSFDGLRLQEELEKEINTEIEIISDIIKEDVFNLENNNEEEPGEEIIIEWEEQEEEKKYLPQ